MAAKVVFANGSKQMAHNLDDLYERWIVRYEKESDTDDAQLLNIFVPELPSTPTLADARKLLEMLKDKHAYLLERNVDINAERHLLSQAEYELKKAPVSKAIIRITRQQAKLKTRIKELFSLPSTEQHELREKAKSGDLSPQDELRRALLRKEQSNREINHWEATLDDLQSQLVVRDELQDKQEHYIKDLTREIRSLQAKLIAAYEQIIELQGGGNDAE